MVLTMVSCPVQNVLCMLDPPSNAMRENCPHFIEVETEAQEKQETQASWIRETDNRQEISVPWKNMERSGERKKAGEGSAAAAERMVGEDLGEEVVVRGIQPQEDLGKRRAALRP